MHEISRAAYADLFGPTTGDRIRLADTDLLIEIEEDLAGGPGRAGDEAVFGGGKVVRESMGQSRATRAEGTPDTVVTGVVVVDHWGVVKADVGIRDGRITGIGKAGNPDTMDGVHPDLVIGPRPRSSRATDASSPPVPSTRTSTSSAPRSPTRRWPPASPPWSAAAPGPPRAPRRPP